MASLHLFFGELVQLIKMPRKRWSVYHKRISINIWYIFLSKKWWKKEIKLSHSCNVSSQWYQDNWIKFTKFERKFSLSFLWSRYARMNIWNQDLKWNTFSEDVLSGWRLSVLLAEQPILLTHRVWRIFLPGFYTLNSNKNEISKTNFS